MSRCIRIDRRGAPSAPIDMSENTIGHNNITLVAPDDWRDHVAAGVPALLGTPRHINNVCIGTSALASDVSNDTVVLDLSTVAVEQ